MIIKCSECGKEISDKAKFCVNCGCPIEDREKQPNDISEKGVRISYNLNGERILQHFDTLSEAKNFCKEHNLLASYYTETEAEPNHERPETATLKIVATIILVCGIIFAVILLIIGALETNFWGVWTGLNTVLIAIGVFLISIVLWAVLRASGNASTDIKEIKEKLK